MFVAVAAIKLVLFLLAGAVTAEQVARARGEFVFVFAALVGFGVAIGPVVAFVRRSLGKERSLRARNFVTGGVVGASYALGCTIVFLDGSGAFEKLVIGIGTMLGIGWAVASALNELVG